MVVEKIFFYILVLAQNLYSCQEPQLELINFSREVMPALQIETLMALRGTSHAFWSEVGKHLCANPDILYPFFRTAAQELSQEGIEESSYLSDGLYEAYWYCIARNVYQVPEVLLGKLPFLECSQSDVSQDDMVWREYNFHVKEQEKELYTKKLQGALRFSRKLVISSLPQGNTNILRDSFFNNEYTFIEIHTPRLSRNFLLDKNTVLAVPNVRLLPDNSSPLCKVFALQNQGRDWNFGEGDLRKLAQNDFDLDACMYQSRPLVRAAILKNKELLKIMIEVGADVNINWGKNRFTLLMEAAIHGNLDTVDLLVGAGADVNAQRSNDGLTALMLMIMRAEEPVEMVQNFLRYNPDVFLEDEKGQTALDYAINYRASERGFFSSSFRGANIPSLDSISILLIQMLLERGATIGLKRQIEGSFCFESVEGLTFFGRKNKDLVRMFIENEICGGRNFGLYIQVLARYARARENSYLLELLAPFDYQEPDTWGCVLS